ncbi:hypothetical protein E1297_11640 [Roseibium sp. RKSG952]|nr:hypothetical protein [Roseibium sp. RKSG952]
MTRMSQIQAQISALQAEVDRGQASIRSMLRDEIGVSGDLLFETLCHRYGICPSVSETAPIPVADAPSDSPVPVNDPASGSDGASDGNGIAIPSSALERTAPVSVQRKVVEPSKARDSFRSAVPARTGGAAKIEVLGVLVPGPYENIADEIVELAREHAAKGDPNGKYSNDRGKNAWRAKLFKKAYEAAIASTASSPRNRRTEVAPESNSGIVRTSRDACAFTPSPDIDEFDGTPSEEFDGSSCVPSPRRPSSGRTEEPQEMRRSSIKPNTPIPMPDDLPDKLHKASRPRPVRPGFLK